LSIYNQGRRVCPSSTCKATTKLEFKSCKSTKGNSRIAALPSRNVMHPSALQRPTAQQSVVLRILHQGIATSPSRTSWKTQLCDIPLRCKPRFSTFSVKILGSLFPAVVWSAKRYPSSPLRHLLLLLFSLLLLPPHNPTLFNQLQFVRHNG
jgi:hypothetical protein